MDTAEPVWWKQGIIYQIYPRSFQDMNGDGIGDLQGVIERLDYLSDVLQVDAVWLSPFYPSPMADFGYDVADYRDVHPMFGDLEAFDRLVQEAHNRGLKVIVDFVPNHTSDQHPWFIESRSSRDNPKRDWYIWRDPKPDGSPPNNWLSVFGGGAWEWDEQTGQYYLHSFLREQPDLNWRNPETRMAMLDVLRFWLGRGVDGFRIDVAHMPMKDPELRDNPPNPNPSSRPIHGRSYDAQHHVYDKAHPDIHDLFREIRQIVDSYGQEAPRVAIGEIYEFDWPTWSSYYGARLDELHMPFNFALLNAPWTAREVRSIVDATEGAVPQGGWPNYVLGNHDRHRVATRVGPAQTRVAMMLLLTLRGTPTVYQGDEIGMHDVEIPPDKVQDPWELNEPGMGLGRDPERTPMQWDDGPNAGFCPEGVEPWLPIAGDYREINVATELDQPASMLSLTRELIRLRQGSPALRDGHYRPVDAVPEDCFVYWREQGNQRFLVALNLSDGEQVIQIPGGESGQICVSTGMERRGQVDLGSLTVRPNEGLVLQIGAS